MHVVTERCEERKTQRKRERNKTSIVGEKENPVRWCRHRRQQWIGPLGGWRLEEDRFSYVLARTLSTERCRRPARALSETAETADWADTLSERHVGGVARRSIRGAGWRGERGGVALTGWEPPSYISRVSGRRLISRVSDATSISGIAIYRFA